MNLISKKKIVIAISESFKRYLIKYQRFQKVPVSYADLSRYLGSATLYDRKGKDTLWVTVYYPPSEQIELHDNLRLLYSILKSNGDISVIEHLFVDRIDMCAYGNTLPFRIRIVNRLNDNFDYFYIKKSDASRVLGLELEHILSPNRINYLVYNDSLIEEHISGIPADQFLATHLIDKHLDEIRLAKEFVKFNERCFIRLLGDMHSSNFIIDITPDFEETHYRMRAIDFDQQCFEGSRKVYLPHFFKQNIKFVELASKELTPESIKQYQLEERTLIANRIKSAKYQVKELLDSIKEDELSSSEKVNNLAFELAEHFENKKFLQANTMGKILKQLLKTLSIHVMHKRF